MAAGAPAARLDSAFAILNPFIRTFTPSTVHGHEFEVVTSDIRVDVLATKTWPADLACSEAQNQITASLSLPMGWDSYDAPVPTTVAAEMARIAIEIVRSNYFAQPHIVASTEGGIAAAFSANDRFAQIELLNSGTVFTTTYSESSSPQVTKFNSDEQSLSKAVETLRDFLS